ncbi:MAG: ferrous iron transport protein A [Flexilinea sp.]
MPITMITPGQTSQIQKITGKDEIRRFLSTLGFVEGEYVSVVNDMGGNMILNIKGTRVALDKTLAQRIIV